LLEQITGPTPPQWQSSSSSPSSSSSSGPVLRKVEQEKPTESSLQSVNGSRPPEVSTKDLVSLQLPSKPPAYGFFFSSSSFSSFLLLLGILLDHGVSIPVTWEYPE
jgi:hypothetical protein